MSKNYDAMVDDEDAIFLKYSHDPVIIFNVHEALKETGNIKLITYGNAYNTTKRYGELRKDEPHGVTN